MGLWLLMIAVATGPNGEVTEVRWGLMPSRTVCEVTGDALTAHLPIYDMAVLGYACVPDTSA